MRAVWIRVLGATALISLVSVGLLFFRAKRDREQLVEQLRLARAEGLPTTWQEYAGQMPPAKPEDNAAPLYRRLEGAIKGIKSKSKGADHFSIEVLLNPSPANRALGNRLLKENAEVLRLAKEAARRPAVGLTAIGRKQSSRCPSSPIQLKVPGDAAINRKRP